MVTDAIQQGVNWVFFAVAVAAFLLELWALAAALRAPAGAYRAAGKQTKGLWVLLTALAAFVGLSSLPVIGSGRGFGSLLTIAAIVVAGVFLAGVRPAVATGRRPPRQQSSGW